MATRSGALLVLLILLVPGTVFGTPRVVKVGVFPAPPLVMVDQGKPTGLFIDLVEEFARENGWTLEYQERPWPDQLAALARGDLDLLPAIGYTTAREPVYDFSHQPVFIDSGVLFSTPGLVVHTLFDLEGKRVAALEKSIFTEAFLANLATFGIHCQLVPTKDNKEVMEALTSGRADAGVTIYSLGTYLARTYPVTITPISFSPIALQFGVPEGKNADLLEAIDRSMAAMRPDSNSLYSQAYRKWTSPPGTNGLFPWLWGSLAVLGGLGLGFGAWTFFLRREVAAQTEDLQEEKEKLAVTLRSIGDGVITTDNGGRVTLMNTVAEALCGWTQTEAFGRPLEDVFTIFREGTSEPCPNPVAQVLSSGRIVELGNHTELVSRGGVRRTIADSAAPILDAQGRSLGVVLVFRDVTEKQRTLEALQRSDKLNSLGVLAGGIAHDFNNLMAGVFGYIELAKKAGEEVPAVAKYLDKAQSVSGRAKGLARQLLTFSKGGLPVRRPADLGPLVRASVAFATSGSNVLCQVHLPDDLWICDFDPDQIGQVVDNLIINARQAMPRGGEITVTGANLEPSEVPLTGLKPGRYVRISLADQGEGIPSAVQPFVFDPFFTTKETGHGLGLAMCSSIVGKHEGAIDFQSVPGLGTTFHVYLPASSSEALDTSPTDAGAHSGAGTILVMDDEAFLRDILGAQLTAMGYSVLSAPDGEALLGVLDARPGVRPRLAFLDLTVPGALGGRDTALVLRTRFPDLVLVACSGFSDDPIIAKPSAFGFQASIRKPFEQKDLVAVLSRHLV